MDVQHCVDDSGWMDGSFVHAQMAVRGGHAILGQIDTHMMEYCHREWEMVDESKLSR